MQLVRRISMCLYENIVKIVPPIDGEGWKVFEVCDDGKMHGICYPETSYAPFRPLMPDNTWLIANKTWTYNDCDAGFHVYENANDAVRLWRSDSSYVLRRVKYRGGHHRGQGDGGWNYDAKVIVVDEIFIL